MKVTFLVCYAFLIQLNENKTKMRITLAKTFNIINSVCQGAFFCFLFPEREKKITALETFCFLKQKEKHLKVKSLYNKILTHKQFVNSMD